MLSRCIDVISAIFNPVIGLLAASGILKGCISLFLAAGWITPDGGTYLIIFAGSDAIFFFLTMVIGYTAGAKFGGNPFLTMIIGGSLIHPNIIAAFNTYQIYDFSEITFLSIPITLVNYTSSIISIIFAAWVSCRLEIILKRFLPSYDQNIITSLICIMTVVPMTFIIIGPVATYISKTLSVSYQIIYDTNPIIAGLVIGLFWEAITILGLHWGFFPVVISNITTLGSDSLIPLAAPAIFSQTGATLGILLATKDNKLKSLSVVAFLSGLVGITKPALYGVNLPNKYPFIIGSVVAALFSAVVGYFNVRVYSFAIPSVLFFPQVISPLGIDNTLWVIISCCTSALLLSAICTYCWYKYINLK